ncbi:hypothetical protein GF336_03520 [Candidatus Woesearchaeota archaeon]|nr:hypothetical protein [Candidatus Woesearchaeota archaeon]
MFKKLKGILSKKEEANVVLNTNAPKEWPSVNVRSLNPENPAIFSINFAASFMEVMKKVNGKIVQLVPKYLGAEGLLEATLEATVKNKRYIVFAFTKSDSTISGQFKTAKKFVNKELNCEALYYAPEVLSEKAKESSPFREFGVDILSVVKEFPKEGYALWWATKKEKKFIGSKVQKDIHRSFKALDQIESYVFGSIARTLKLSEGSRRVGLPKEPITLPIEGPNNEIFLLYASSEKGIQFRFNTKKDAKYRDFFWNQFAKYAEGWKKVILKEGWPLDQYKDNHPYEWYKFLEQNTKKDGAKDLKIGLSILK